MGLPHGRLVVVTVVFVVAALALAACGSDDEPSAEEQASAQVCDARDGIAEEVDRLAGMTITTVTADDVTSSLRAIQGNLQTIADNESELSADRRQEVEQATSRFADEVRGVLSVLGRSLSLSDAREQLSTALSQLGEAYRSSLERIDCG